MRIVGLEAYAYNLSRIRAEEKRRAEQAEIAYQQMTEGWSHRGRRAPAGAAKEERGWRARLQLPPRRLAPTALAVAQRLGQQIGKVPGWDSWKTLVSFTAYHSFGGEVEASNTPSIRRLIPSRRHQLSPIAHANQIRAKLMSLIYG